MRLDLVQPRGDGGHDVIAASAGVPPVPFGLYRAEYGQVYALTPDDLRELDPDWREATG